MASSEKVMLYDLLILYIRIVKYLVSLAFEKFKNVENVNIPATKT